MGVDSPPVSTKGNTLVGFCGGGAPNMGAHMGTRKEHQATWELWQVRLYGGLPSLGFSVPDTICLVGSLLGHTTIPYLRQSSFISLSQKKICT